MGDSNNNMDYFTDKLPTQNSIQPGSNYANQQKQTVTRNQAQMGGNQRLGY